MTPEQLASTRVGSIVAAAGCGKTELIARAVSASSGRQLVLTHTNAGVEALRRRIRRHGVATDRLAVDTIAGWCLKYLTAYPGKAGTTGFDAEQMDWDGVHRGMNRLAIDAAVGRVLQASYDGVFVDEYQDCGATQHALIRQLALLLPVRVLGDPLQAVFGFDRTLPAWSAVRAAFPQVGELTTPWRWRREGENSKLGEWLLYARTCLQTGTVLDFRTGPVNYVPVGSPTNWMGPAVSTCFEVGRQDGSVAAIMKWPNREYMLLGQLTGGYYQCVEAIEARDAGSFLTALESAIPHERGAHLCNLIPLLASNASEPLAEMARMRAFPGNYAEPFGRAIELLNSVAAGAAPATAADTLEQLTQLPGVRTFRRELLWAICDALRDANDAGYAGLRELFRRRRNLTSHIGRRLARRSCGSTLLLKGMEFDHAVVVNTGNFSANDLYVAITRGSKSLTFISPEPTVAYPMS